jgi:hypothetical protein
MLEGAQDVQRQLAKRGIGYGCHVERPGHRGPHLRTLVQQASLTITEEMPVEPLRRWTARLARESDIPLLAVDTACVVPMQIVGKAHARAFEFRKATKDHYSQRLTLPAHEAEPAVVSAQLKLPFEPVDFHTTTIADLVSECEIDHAIGPVPHTVGGSTAGYQRWNRFMHRGLSRYARVRNDALLDGVSRMSAYLHHGMVSPQRVAREAAESNSDGAQKYLDELLIWRELAHGFCFYRPDHGRLGALPQWAIETLAEHQCDERPALHSWETMARAQTGDALWDAAQQSLLMHGELHNNVRMTWGKAILNWTPDARSALATIVDLNHRYALDGQDPASFGGILWCLGQFDRPFTPARPILGTVRDRSTEQHAKRLDTVGFERKITRALVASMPTVAVIGAGLSGLICARTLSDHGFPVTIFEKSRGVGGRMSTRRLADGLHFDHGAQYFTTCDKRLRRLVKSWMHDGLVARWDGEIVVLDNGQITGRKPQDERFVAAPGMSAIAKHLAQGLDIDLHTQVAPLIRANDGWTIANTEGAQLGHFDVAIVSAPAAQTTQLLAAAPMISQRSAAIPMHGCWALLLAFEASLELSFDAAFVHGSDLAWIAKNSSKPQRDSGVETWTVHASAQWSEANIELEKAAVLERLLAEFWRVTSATQIHTVHADAHRWRYAMPGAPLSTPCLFDAEQKVGACGDWCGGPHVEGALVSGIAAAGRVMLLLEA